MSNIDKRALREAAEKATPGRWEYYPGNTSIEYNVDSMDEGQGSIVYVDSGDFTKKQTDLNGAFIAAANPATVLSLLDELEAKDNRINRLEAIVAVAEQRNALMREWKRALKVPCDLVDDQVPVVIHGMVIRLERLKEAEAKLEVAESGFPPLTVERLMREKDALEKRVVELEARMVKLPERYEVDMCPTPSPDGEWYSREDILAALVSVPDDNAITQHFDTIALETAREIMCDVNRRHEFLGGEVQLLSRIQCRIDDACRAAMLQGTDGTLTNEGTKRVGELAMWVKRLAHSLRKANPDSKLQSDAMDYLRRKGLIGVEDILR